MSRELLLERLEALDPITAAECFVLLWTYLDLDHLKSAENFARAREIHPFRIEEFLRAGGSPATGLRATIAALRTREGAAFDFATVQWIRALDERLRDRSPETLDGLGPFQGLDRLSYQVRPRNGFLVRVFREHRLEAPAGIKQQSGTLDLYTPTFKAVPKTLKPGGTTTVDVRPFFDWAPRSLRSRLERKQEQRALRILHWPLSRHVDYLHGPAEADFLRLHGVRNGTDLEAEVAEALAAAAAERATFLVFPELVLSSSALAHLQGCLRDDRRNPYPLLTIAGCCHSPWGPGDCDANEAVVLGPDGQELHRHRKLAAYSASKDGQLYGERLEVGKAVTVLESPVGNLCVLICLDLFHDPHKPFVAASHANFFLVPSLSPKTSAHEARAKELVATHQAGTFVANRTYEPAIQPESSAPPPPWASFFQLPVRGGPVRHHPATSRYLCFSLNEELQRLDKANI